MKITFNRQNDTLVVEVEDHKPANEEDSVTIDRVPNHVWKMNKEKGLVYHLKIERASEEFGLVWLNGVFTSQLYEYGNGASLLEQMIENQQASQNETSSGLVIAGMEDVAKYG